jgi:hypothetical protein
MLLSRLGAVNSQMETSLPLPTGKPMLPNSKPEATHRNTAPSFKTSKPGCRTNHRQGQRFCDFC